MTVIQDQRLPLFQGIRLQFVRHFAERIFHEGFLQDRLFAFRPAPQNGFGKRYPRATTCRDRFRRDGLPQFPQFIKAFWSPFAQAERKPYKTNEKASRFRDGLVPRADHFTIREENMKKFQSLIISDL